MAERTVLNEAGTDSTGPVLYQIALADLVFGSHKKYNDSLRAFRENTGKSGDRLDKQYCDHLLTWLNQWGCRHLARGQHRVASASICDWHEQKASLLPPPLKPLWELDDEELKDAATAYESLRRRDGARRTKTKTGQMANIGPTAASKILFALRPEALPPWDEKMRKELGYSGGAKGYVEFLNMMRARARALCEQCRENGFDITALPEQMERNASTVVDLLNEHLWVTVSAGVRLPSRETLAIWAKW